MRHFRKIWDKKKHEFLMENREMKIHDCYLLFLQKFPEANDVTETAFRNERSRIGAISEKFKSRNLYRGTRISKPLFSEHEKKGYIIIKVAQPNKWMFKQHWVWLQNTGHKPEKRKETVIFLDGNNRNFNFENLYLLQRKIMPILNNPRLNLGVVKDNPEATLLNIKTAELIHATFQAGRKAGLVSESSGRFYSDINEYEKRRRENKTPEQKEKDRQKHHESWEKLKANPEKLRIHNEKQKIYQKNYAKRKKARAK